MSPNIRINFFKYRKPKIADLEKKPDEELITLYRETQEKQIVSILLKRHSDMIISFAINYFREESDVKDLAQELFLKLCDKLLTHNVQHFKSWLVMIIRNNQIDSLRKKQSKSNYIDHMLNGGSISYEQPRTPGLKYQHVYSALNDLPEHERLCIEEVYFKEKKYSDIMQEHNWTFNQVRGYRDRGIQKLRKLLKDT